VHQHIGFLFQRCEVGGEKENILATERERGKAFAALLPEGQNLRFNGTSSPTELPPIVRNSVKERGGKI
jgi:hypothetical protein